ncbi:MAG: ATP-dependent DNA helicase RecG [Deltaproteobacteria bacterium CG11_big_fil_rev_8_21_14_0_20_47_16]|nr:MAG: ATP-dependent DNA helicase RecG [Deltaproteobacteria bacterium CG11_big_fil_rev_8_21_14_0_20_47_16]
MTSTQPNNPLATPVQYVKGVGPRIAALLEKRGITTVEHLFFHLPTRYIDRRNVSKISQLTIGKDRTTVARVQSQGARIIGRGRRVYEVVFTDGTGQLIARWFRFNGKIMGKRFLLDTDYLLAGDVSFFGRGKQMIHPEIESMSDPEDSLIGGRILPIYPSTEGLSQRMIRKIMKNAWEKFGSDIGDSLPAPLKISNRIAPLRVSLSCLHFPPANFEVDSLNQHSNEMHQGVVFEESFFFFLGLGIRNQAIEHKKTTAYPLPSSLAEQGRRTLPFELTGDQKTVLSEIATDLGRDVPMHRMLQGDVGSGKTVVALLSALQVVGLGDQVALMAPTELLAQQHYHSFKRVLDDLRIPVACLTSQVKGKERRAIYEALSDGSLPIIVGTHALIQEDVRFKKLGMVIIDEQHRFGVLQRQDMMQKGINPHLLVMTATPIPRTLSMTIYGDLNVSIIREMPPGRRPVVTKIYRESLREKLYHGMRVELEKGHQIYVVYPLIEESEKMDLKNATDMAAKLAEVFEPKFKVALLHGKMKGDEKESIMQSFKDKKAQVLVTTSVIEVGVDVPNATVMVIEHAERFGLSQLHQLRGRIGRSDIQSYCILLNHGAPGSASVDRMQILENSTDGFAIAEADLEIRGPGEFLGTRQSGLPDLQVTNLARDGDILSRAKEAAFRILFQDPKLSAPENQGLRETVARRWAHKLSLGDVA